MRLRHPIILFVLCLIAGRVQTLCAAPDPDIFDGRVPTPASQGQASANAAALDETEANTPNGKAAETPEQSRDLSQIDGTTAGDSVATQSSKTADAEMGSKRDLSEMNTVGGGQGVADASSKADTTSTPGIAEANPTGGTSGSGAAVGVQSGSTAANNSVGGSSAMPSGRNFQDFGFGSTSSDAAESVEVKRSKGVSTSLPGGAMPTADQAPASNGIVSAPWSSSSQQKSRESAAGDSETTAGNIDADYGVTLPSGL